nr:probable cyclic nucleotide-gated ion channel 20, chloroplastic [Tanacetum cinerariifolium]
MDDHVKDDIPILSATDWPSDRHEYYPKRRFSNENRSVSISIPVSSTESKSAAAGHFGFSGSLRNDKKSPKEPVEQELPKVYNHQWGKHDGEAKNEHLIRSGQLGMCNDPYCTTCPSAYNYKGQLLISRVSQGLDHSLVYGSAKGWAREKLSLLKHFTFGVMNPHAKVVQQWNQFIVISCLLAIFIDPLFFYLLSVNKDNKCIVISWPMTKAIVAFRSITDFIYLMHMLVQFRLAFVSPESRVVGAGDLVDNPRKIALHYLSGFFPLDLFIVLPLPQPNTRARLPRNGENSRMMGCVGPMTVSPTPNPNHPTWDTVQLETAVSTISQEYLLEFTSEYGISENLHPELPGSEERIVDFLEGKVGVYTKFFEFANFRLPLSQFLFDILGHYQIHLSQLKRPGKNTPQCYTKPLDSLKNWNNRFFWVDERVFLTVADWRTSAPKDEMPAKDTYSVEAVTILNTHRTPIQKQPEALLCLVGLSSEIFPGRRLADMDLFNLIRALNPTKVKTGTRPRAAHEVPLLTVTASRVIEMEDPATAIDSSGVPSTIERSPLDFANENPSQQSTGGNGTEDQGQETVAPEVPPSENVATTGVAPKAGPAEEIAAMGPRTLVDVSDPDLLSFANPQSIPTENVAQYANISYSSRAAVAGDPGSEHTSFTSMVGSPESLYQPEWGVTNGCSLDAPKACQDLVDHIAPPGYFSELRHLHNDDFLKQYNINLARQVAMGSQLRLRFEQEAKLLKKSAAQLARRDQRIQARKNEIKNLETLLEAETDMKKTTEAKNAKLGKELENLRALFSDLQVSNDRLSQQVSTLQAQVTREEKLKASFEEFKQYEDNRVEKRCAEMDARLDALSIDFDEELYPHMLTAIAGRRWVIGHGLRLAVMKCEHGKANLGLEAIEAYDPEAETKYVAALHALRDLKYPMVDQLESLKDAPIDVIMASLHLESDTGDDAPQWIRELRRSSSQLKIPVYPEVRDPKDPWPCKEEILLADAIAANVSRAEKKKKC